MECDDNVLVYFKFFSGFGLLCKKLLKRVFFLKMKLDLVRVRVKEKVEVVWMIYEYK